MRFIILVTGAPAGGKSTLARELVSQYRILQQRVMPYLSTDGIRRAIAGDEYVAEMRMPIYDGLSALAKSLVAAGMDVLVDGNFVDSSRRQQVYEIAKTSDVRVVSVLVHSTLDVHLGRNNKRSDSEKVPEDYLRRTYAEADQLGGKVDFVVDTNIVASGQMAERVLSFCLRES